MCTFFDNCIESAKPKQKFVEQGYKADDKRKSLAGKKYPKRNATLRKPM